MGTIDIILLVCLAPGIISGIRKGFISQVVSILSLILGIWAAFRFSSNLGEWLGERLEMSVAVVNIVSFVLIFVAITLALHLVAKIAEKLLRAVALGWADKVLGIVFALLKYLLVIGLIVMAFNELNTKFTIVSAEKLDDSVLYGPIRDFAYKIFPYLKSAISGGKS